MSTHPHTARHGAAPAHRHTHDHAHGGRRPDHGYERTSGPRASTRAVKATATDWCRTPSSAPARASARCSSRWPCLASPPSPRRSSSCSRVRSRCWPTSSTTSATPLTAVPLGIAFAAAQRPARRALRRARSSSPPSSSAPASPASRPCRRLIDPEFHPTTSGALAGAGRHRLPRATASPRSVRTARGTAGSTARRSSPTAHHARADAYVSLAGHRVGGGRCAIGIPIADPLIGLAITLVILRITWQSWRTVRGQRIVDPIAPYFFALRRVSSNCEWEYVSTRSPCLMSV